MDTAPVGWLKANGAALSRSTYANLFAAIGTRFGEGDGSTTFNLPDLRGLFLRGWDDGRGLDKDKNRELGSLQQDETFSDKDKTNRYYLVDSKDHKNKILIEQNNLQQEAIYKTNMVSTAVFGSDHLISIGGRSSEVRPLNVALLACIKI
ncbi:tail fiber protein [Snodgrassella sp. ESL0304]|nr:tail fiber protein [Snodgrassella sp. ESL0304]